MAKTIDLDMGDITDIDIGSNGTVVEKRDDIALIDADTLVFGACLSCETMEELMPKEYYTQEEWDALLSDPGYFEPEHALYSIDLDVAYQYSKEKLQTILDNTGCSDYELHFTSGRKSFRYLQVDKNYKANRTADVTKRAPVGLEAIKDLWVEREPFKAFKHKEWEADDIVVAAKKEWPEKYLLVALDKDVLYSLPGTHFNYYMSAQYNIDMKFIEVDEERAMKHHYIQTLMGDASDGVIGLKGVGAKTAEKILKDCTTEQECWGAVMKAYADVGLLKNGTIANEIDAITNMRLVSMHQLVLKDGVWEVQLWKPKSM